MNPKYLIYALLEHDTLEVRYVGRTCNGIQRAHQHYNRNIKSNCYVDYWARKRKQDGFPKKFVVLYSWQSNPGNDIINEAERLFIWYFKGTHNRLLNRTDGGDGVSGFKCAEETKRKISIANKGRTLPLDHPLRNHMDGSPFKGKKHKEETKKIISDNNSVPIIRSDGKIFKSLRKAALDLGVQSSVVWCALNDKNKTCQGYRFSYYKGLGTAIPKHPIKAAKRTKITWEGIEYKSINEACRASGIPHTTFFRLVHKKGLVKP